MHTIKETRFYKAGWHLDAQDNTVALERWTTLYLWDSLTEKLLHITVNADDFMKVALGGKTASVASQNEIRNMLGTLYEGWAEQKIPDSLDTRNNIALFATGYAGSTQAFATLPDWHMGHFVVMLYRKKKGLETRLRPFGWKSDSMIEAVSYVLATIQEVMQIDKHRHPEWFVK